MIGNDGEMIELVNPEIIASEGEQTGPEGCLSLPGKFGLVTRPNYVRVRANDRYGNVFEAEGTEMTARCFCHEIEHLDGHLFDEHVDHFMTEDDFEEYYAAHEAELKAMAEAHEAAKDGEDA